MCIRDRCKGHDVSARYIDKVQGTWLMKYPSTHDPYEVK
jgi:hypothetical protein